MGTTDEIPWLFPDFDSKLQNSLTCNKIPWLFPDSAKDWKFPDNQSIIDWLIDWLMIIGWWHDDNDDDDDDNDDDSADITTKLTKFEWIRHNRQHSVSNHQPHYCLLSLRSSKKTSKLCVTSLCVGNSPGTGEFPAQMASNAENVSIWWRHHVYGFVFFPMMTWKRFFPLLELCEGNPSVTSVFLSQRASNAEYFLCF